MPRKQIENTNEAKSPCPKCGSPLYRRSIQVVRGSCWRCHAAMPIAFGSDGMTMMGPAEFVSPEIEVAIKGGALLRDHSSKTTRTKYLANTCHSCGTFCGDFNLHDFWYNEPIILPVETVLGCLECFTAVAIAPATDGSVWTGIIPHQADDDTEVSSETAKRPSEKSQTKSKQKLDRPAAPLMVSTKRSPIWGRCGECGESACPATVNNEKFFCNECRGIRRFIPDPL